MNEYPIPLNANHANVCKFETPTDPTYFLLKNSLLKATEDILGDSEANPTPTQNIHK